MPGVIDQTDMEMALQVIMKRFEKECRLYDAQLIAARAAEASASSQRVPYPLPPRILVGMAGRPGSGKTTALEVIAKELERRLTVLYVKRQRHEHQQRVSTQAHLPPFPPRCVCMPMDGYHLYRRELNAMKDPKRAFERRGAEWTFNPEKLARDLQALRKVDPSTAGTSSPRYCDVKVPSFNHGVGDPVEDDIIVPSAASIIMVEGNYLLFTDKPAWAAVVRQWDVKLFLYCPRDICTERLCRRHMKAWNISRDKAMVRAQGSDTKNGDLVDTTQKNADFVVHSVELKSLL